VSREWGDPDAPVASQPPCACPDCDKWGPCSASPWQSTGTCPGSDGTCTHYGTEVDGGLCEGCYVATK